MKPLRLALIFLAIVGGASLTLHVAGYGARRPAPHVLPAFVP